MITQEKANEIIKQYRELYNFVLEKSDSVWDTYILATTNAYKDHDEKWWNWRYDFERLEVLDEDSQYVVFEHYRCGDTDSITIPLEWFFDDNLFNTIYNKTFASILKSKEEKRIKKEQEEEDAKQREIAYLKKLKEKYPNEA